MYLYICAALLVTNFLTLFLYFRKSRSKPEKTLDVSATALLEELLKGQALLVTNVLDPDALFHWSPKR